MFLATCVFLLPPKSGRKEFIGMCGYEIFLVNLLLVGNSYNIYHIPRFKIRTILLMILAIALNAVVIVEQPGNSLLEYYPRFRDWIMMVQHTGGMHAVPCPFCQVSSV